MLLSSLEELVDRGEGLKLEFKSDGEGLSPEDVAKQIVAFATMRGGIILIGVEDDW